MKRISLLNCLVRLVSILYCVGIVTVYYAAIVCACSKAIICLFCCLSSIVTIITMFVSKVTTHVLFKTP